MAAITPTIIVNSTPALSVTVADPGVPGVTYSQIQNSLGQYVYFLRGFYLQAESIAQLIGVIKFLIFDADGNQTISNIAATVDPYQDQKSIIYDLANFETDIILNGNSSLEFTILPNETLQFTIYTRRITNSFSRNLTNFIIQEDITNKPNFFKSYGNLFRIAQDNYLAQQSAVVGSKVLPPKDLGEEGVDISGSISSNSI